VKKLLLLASLAVLSSPYLASAQGWRPIGYPPHRGIGAPEMAAVGLGISALIGAIGYLVLRRRNDA
jgi:LPXTG-motif cell wall-anchored protein